jgi:hypothetical protein
MNSATSFETLPLTERAKKAALSRWKLETLTGLLGIRSLQAHNRMSQLNQEAENRAVRQKVWGNDGGASKADEMGDHIILGDNTNPAPIIITGQQQSSGSLGKVLAGAALGAALLGIPGAGVAGYLFSKLSQQKPEPQVITPTDEDTTIGLGLRKFEELEQ